MRRPPFLSAPAILSAALVPALVPASATAATDYERDIMPIFEKKCFDCHSAAADKVKGGLRLDEPRAFYQRFKKNDVVVPGNWDASYLFVVVSRPQDHKEAMPPKDKGEPLTPEEILAVANWIHDGARIDGERGERGAKDDKPDDILKFKDGRMVTEAFEAQPEERLRDWTNRDGKKIVAVFKGVEGGNAVLVTEDGRRFQYPLEKLSDPSRALIRELSGEETK